MLKLPSEKSKALESARAARRTVPSALSTPEEGRQRQADVVPQVDSQTSDAIYGDKGVGRGFKY